MRNQNQNQDAGIIHHRLINQGQGQIATTVITYASSTEVRSCPRREREDPVESGFLTKEFKLEPVC